ncbi:MAG TPA: hypothetical protein VMK12_31020 [Anaeromyxobacteraceae bacterium]|nr:hypothetical protein [Anaeromyxobacteraceae bacterium]
MPTRERFFECIFSSDRNEYRFHVRAWDAAEAEAHLRASLRANGLRELGAILVRDDHGTLLRKATYAGEGSSASA